MIGCSAFTLFLPTKFLYFIQLILTCVVFFYQLLITPTLRCSLDAITHRGLSSLLDSITKIIVNIFILSIINCKSYCLCVCVYVCVCICREINWILTQLLLLLLFLIPYIFGLRLNIFFIFVLFILVWTLAQTTYDVPIK